MKKSWKNILVAVILTVLSIVPLWDLLTPGYPVTHDGRDHVARIANFYLSLSEGNIVPRWAANLNWGYGHPILMFLYPLPSYTGSLFRAIGFSFVDSTKLVFAVGFAASIFAMYLWAYASWGKAAGLTAAILYGFAPYRFIDLYVRGAIGEHMAFIFPPLICYGLLISARSKTGFSAGAFTIIAVGTGLLILAHNALSLMFLPLILFYALYLAGYGAANRLRFLLSVIVGIGMGFLLSAFYWVPGFFEGKYTLRDIVTAGEFSGRFVPWLSFIYSPWSYGGGNELSKWLGAGSWLAVIMGFFVLERNSKYRGMMVGSILILFFAMFTMTSSSTPLWNTITLLQKFQFPWRLLSVTTFVTAVIGALVVCSSASKKRVVTAILLCLVAVLTTIPMWRAREYKIMPEQYFTGIYNGTTDTGESSPIWSVRFMEKRPDAAAYLMPELGTITGGLRTTTTRAYAVTATSPVRFVENTLYFPGWQVYINNSQIDPEKLIFQDPTYRGLMTFDLDPGTYDIRFVFTDTKLRRLSNYISLGSLLALLVFGGTIHILWRRRKLS